MHTPAADVFWASPAAGPPWPWVPLGVRWLWPAEGLALRTHRCLLGLFSPRCTELSQAGTSSLNSNAFIWHLKHKPPWGKPVLFAWSWRTPGSDTRPPNSYITTPSYPHLWKQPLSAVPNSLRFTRCLSEAGLGFGALPDQNPLSPSRFC